MRIDQSTRDGCAILSPVGELDLAAVPPLRQVLLKRLAEQPVAVICDLAGLWSVDPACAAVFATVANHPSSRWPETTLLLCGAQPTVAAVLDRLGASQFLPMHASLEDASTQAFARPPYLRAELPLGPAPTAPAAARRFVRDACWSWQLEEVDDPDDPMERLWCQDLVDRRPRPGRGRAAGRRLGGCTILPRAARSSGACWNADQPLEFGSCGGALTRLAAEAA